MAKEGTFQLLGQPNPDAADINKGRIFWNTITDTFQQIDENGVIKDLTSENPAGNNTNIQFNNLGTLGGSDDFVFDGTAVGIGTLTPDESSILNLSTTVRGFLMPVLTTIEREAIPSPATGLEIYNSDNTEPEFFNGSIWQSIGSSAGTYSLSGGISTIGQNLIKSASYGHNSATEGYVMAEDGQLTSLAGALTAPLTAGQCTLRIAINGVAKTGVNQTININVTEDNASIIFDEPIIYLKNSIITLESVTVNAAPTGADLTIIIRLQDKAIVPEEPSTNFAYVVNEDFPAEVVSLESVKRAIAFPFIEVETEIGEEFDPVLDFVTWDGVDFTISGPKPIDIDAGGANAQVLFNNNGFQAGIPSITTDGTNLAVEDAAKITFGNSEDLKIEHTGLVSEIQNLTGDLLIINQGAAFGDIVIENFSGTNDIVNRLGSDNVNTKFIVKNSLNAEVFSIDGDGDVNIDDGPLIINGQLSLNHTAGSTRITSTTGIFTIDQAADAPLIIENLSTSNDIFMRLGNFGNTTNFKIQDGGIDDIFVVQGDAKTSIGTNSSPDASALLTLDSTLIGFLMPRMTTTQRDAIFSPATGLEIYNTTTNEPEFFDGSAWITTGGTAPGGSNTQVQFNNSGAFAGISGVTTDGAQLDFANGARARFGSGQDLIIEHLGDSTIINNTGELQAIQLASSDVLLRLGGSVGSTAFKIQDDGLTEIVRIVDNGAVGIGGTPVTSAILDLTSTTRGFLMPVMTTTQRDAIFSPATGLEIYNLTTNEPEFFNGSIWQNTGATAPGGADTQIQFNNNGTFDGNADFVFNGSNFVFDNASLKITDSSGIHIGPIAAPDLIISHGGLDGTIVNETGDFKIENQAVDKDIIFEVGSLTNATNIRFKDSGSTDLFVINGDGNIDIPQDGILRFGDAPEPEFQISHVPGLTKLKNIGAMIISTSTSNDIIIELGTTNEFSAFAIQDSSENPIAFIDALGDQFLASSLGIGTVSAEAPLHILSGTALGGGTIAGTQQLIESDDGAIIAFRNPDNSPAGIIFGNAETPAVAGILHDDSVAGAIEFFTDGQARVLLLETGEVSTPTGEDLIISPDQANVGIDTPTPEVKLDVNGSIRAVDTYKFSDGSTQSQAAIPDGNKGFVNTAIFKTSHDVSADVGVTSNSTHSVFIRPDGLKMYVLGAIAAQILEYDLSTPHLVSTAVFLQRSTLSGGTENQPTDFYFRSDGLKMYSVGINADRLIEHNLSTAWDISTISVVQSIVVTTQDGVAAGLYFRPDGKKMYLSGQENDLIHEFDLTTSWDISTASVVQTFSTLDQDTLPTGLVFKADGKKMYLSGDQNNSIYEYDLSTPWDVTTAIFQQSFSVTTQDSQPRGIFLREDAQALYFAGNGNETIYQFDLGAIFVGRVGIGTDTDTLDSKLVVKENPATIVGAWSNDGIAGVVDNNWVGIVGDETGKNMVAVSTNGTDRVMTSNDNGVTWINVSTPLDSVFLTDVAFGNGTWVVCAIGTQFMTSTDNGATWDIRTVDDSFDWEAITFGNNQFVAMSNNTANAVTSPDGITWTTQTTPTNVMYVDVVFGNGLFVAVGESAVASFPFHTSPDGITWTQRASDESRVHKSIAFGNGIFVVVSNTGSGDQVETSPDGITWTTQTTPTPTKGWSSVTFQNGIFMAVSNSGIDNRAMSSVDGGLTWLSLATPVDNNWEGIAVGVDSFVAVSNTGTGDRAMTMPLIGTSTAILDMQSTTSGFLPPRMTELNRDNIPSPVAGLILYNNESNKIDNFNGVDYLAVSNVNSGTTEIANSAELEALATGGIITIDSNRTYMINGNLSSDVELVFENRATLHVVTGNSNQSSWVYTGTGNFLSGTGGFRSLEFMDFIGTSSGTFANLNLSGRSLNMTIIGLFGWGDLGTVTGGLVFLQRSEISDNILGFKLIDCRLTITSGQVNNTPSSALPFIDIDNSLVTGREITVTNVTGNFSVGASLFRFDPSLDPTGLVTITGVAFEGNLFDTTGGSTGIFTAVADAAVPAEAITSVTDSSGVARFNFTAPPTLFVNQEVVISTFVTNTAYNGTFIITATGANFFEVSSIAFGSDETGSFLSNSVTLTDTATTLNDGDTLVIDTDDAIDYDGGATVYNQLTNSFQINRTFTQNETGTWDTSGIDQKDPRILATRNPGFPDSNSIAYGSVNAQGSLTTISDGAYLAIDTTDFTDNNVTERYKLTEPNFGQYTFTGNEDFSGTLTANISTIKTTSIQNYRFAVSINEVLPVFATAIYAPLEVKTTKVQTTLTLPVQLTKGDTVQIVAAGDGTADDMTVTDLLLSIN